MAPVRVRLPFLTLAVGLLLAACGDARALATDPPSAAAAVESPAATASATRPAATSTRPPVPTAAALPTRPAATPTTEPTATPPPTPTRAIPGIIGPVEYPADVNPLTGLVVRDPRVLERRPIAIKIANLARVRPQSGLNAADLVFEHLTEGGITRFTAIFYTNDAAKVGSVRSARLIDLQLPLIYDAAFAYSGSATEVRQRIHDSAFYPRVVSPDFAHGGFARIPDPAQPQQSYVDILFTSTYDLRWILGQRGQDVRPNYELGMAFHPETPAGGQVARNVEVGYLGTSAYWHYNPGFGRYFRWSDGEEHLDAATGEQVSFKNVIVLFAPHEEAAFLEDTGGSRSLLIDLTGEGQALVFRGGQVYEATWRHQQPTDMLLYYDRQGDLLPLAPGNTFVQVVPVDYAQIYVNQ
jgi:hypothetical protein